MAYVVCQTGKCQQTYSVEQFAKNCKNVLCEKCGGILLDGKGMGYFSQNPTVIPVISIQEITEREKDILLRKRSEYQKLETEIKELESTSNCE